ncbi:hypothetical protein RHABOEDO_000122 [Candidatus Rhabdochlamydia oedothoracis]|uniref:Uncharacterized protein n=1 Tax=Candidatus Rhabdochlamydia oedothoracis TaxID=2720720 RepID=A0ABX8UYJ2_9BACT|nr:MULTISPECIES: hypothetical protein [Rhabdochlamydia]KAG6559890.1 hypothetical protein RHOW815_000073 [Candidatus Rhabdochlamydia sp. W815]QYF48032.1 hypothetical protein RHABOEDO_000122 [Candidatus Rhabdochlamydia oedothoracis]
MIVLLSAKYSIRCLFNYCIMGVCACIIALSSGLLFFSYPLPDVKTRLMQEVSQVRIPLHPYELIGSFALALNEYHTSSWARRIANELLVLGYNTRPDQQSSVSMAFSLNKEKNPFTVQNEELVFLEESKEGLVRSEKKTALWIQPILLNNGAILIKVSRQFHSTEQNAEFISSSSGLLQMQNDDFMQQLQNSSYLSFDLLIQHYGGPRFAGWEKKGTLKCVNQMQNYACFVSEADLLVFKNQQWQVASLTTKTQGLPLARVKKLLPEQMQLEVWDEKGFCSSLIEVPLRKKKFKKMKLEIPFTKIRMRSATQVSCSLGKKRLFLKQGDWLFKTSSGWCRLDKPRDIEDYVYHRLLAEVFIFDAIVKEQGCSFMKGTLFDETRMHMQQIQLPIQTEKKEAKTRKKTFLLLPFTLKGCL